MKRKIFSILFALVLVLSFSLIPAMPAMAITGLYVAPTGNDSTGDGSQANPYKTIQHAIDVAVAGDTINVAAGTYKPFGWSSKDNITVKSTDGPSHTFIVGRAMGDLPVVGGSSIFAGIYIENSADAHIEGFDVEFNVYKGGNGIWVYADYGEECPRAHIKGNIVHQCGDQGITLKTAPNSVVEDNTVSSSAMGIWVSYSSHTTLIKDNIVSDNKHGQGDKIGIYLSSNNCTATGNTVYDNGVRLDGVEGGIRIAGANNILEHNDIYNNTTGIELMTGANNVANFNNIRGNTAFGVFSRGGSIDATNNWWGNATGPKQATTNPNGRGNAVSNYVTYSPWYLVPKESLGTETTVTTTGFGQQSQAFASTNTTVSTSNTTGTGDVTVKTFNYTVPTDAGASLSASVGKKALKYVDVKIANNTYSGNVTVTLSYTAGDLAKMGVKEDGLALYYWNMPSGPWTLAFNSSVNKVNKTVSGDIPASKLTGTPLSLGGSAETTGQYQVGESPTVTGVTFAPTAMDPMVEQTVTVGVSVPSGRTLAELTQVPFKVWFDSNGGAPTPSEFNSAAANTQTGAIITWTPGGGFAISPSTSTTWALGTCTAPTLTGTSGTFTLKFTPGKVATETTGGAVWQLAAIATSDYGNSNLGYVSPGVAMNWYGELALGTTLNVDWGLVPAGMDFTNAKSKQSLGTTITYISNGAYGKIAKSSATWVGPTSNTAALNASGTPGSNEFSLGAYNADAQASAKLLNSTGVTFNTGTLTTEPGNIDSNNYLWLKLGSIFNADTYSGTITYVIRSP